MENLSPLNPPQRILLGPGPSNVHPAVYQALATPIVGHLDPDFLGIMNDIQNLLRYVFQTENALTIAVSGTGTAGMEAALTNTIEPDDTIVVAVHGYFGARLAEIARRCGANVVEVKSPWGEITDPQRIADALTGAGKVKAVAVVHAETSTGVLQPLSEISSLCKQHGALLIVDAVTSLGGLPVKVDEWQIDVCYSGTQKCIGCPPGLAPITFSETALNAARKRKKKSPSWYFDVTLIADYWADSKRAYHHTAPISMNYALRETLRLLHEEGLEARFERHRRNWRELIAGLQKLDLSLLVDEPNRLPCLTSVKTPAGVEEAKVRKTLLNEYSIEIGGGLGELAGKIWRIGLMGESSRKQNVVYLLAALKEILKK
jgi:alanine-glyoxylate transaminase/serine-glyoxylate transaminase/serine-pyruvate transaminase